MYSNEFLALATAVSQHTSLAGDKVGHAYVQQRQVKGLLYVLLQHRHECVSKQSHMSSIALLGCL